MSELKTIIFHQGYQKYLDLNCQITSKKNEIILLGDKSLKKMDKIKNVDFIDIDKYLKNEKIDFYKKHFQPYNTTPEKYVWLWYLRIFVMKLFLEENNLNTIFHLDSDNILFENINDFNYEFENAYLVNDNFIPTHMTASIHCGLLSNTFFKEFESLYEDIFINKQKFHLIEEKIQFHEKFGKGGICDMTLFYLLFKEKYIKVQNLMNPVLSKINGEDYFFMDNFSDPEGDLGKNQFRTNYKKKIKLYMNKDGKTLQIYDVIRQKKLNLINIHFQGSAKKFINSKFLKNYL